MQPTTWWGRNRVYLSVACTLLLGVLVLRAIQARDDLRQRAAEQQGAAAKISDESAALARAAIQKALDDQAAAWNKGDLEGFMKGYWNSPELSFFSGKDKTKGWQATFDRYKKRYQAEGKEMGKLTFSELQIDVLSLDSAFVRGRYGLETSKGPLGGLFTLIVKKLPEGWRIVHDHTSTGA